MADTTYRMCSNTMLTFAMASCVGWAYQMMMMMMMMLPVVIVGKIGDVAYDDEDDDGGDDDVIVFVFGVAGVGVGVVLRISSVCGMDLGTWQMFCRLVVSNCNCVVKVRFFRRTSIY